MYPPLPFLPRICTSDYTIPGTNIKIKAGTVIIVPIRSLQRDPLYFPEPEVFQPERFMSGLNHQYVFMPFGEGPRQCIGNFLYPVLTYY
jgi:cytochrome P450 family 6